MSYLDNSVDFDKLIKVNQYGVTVATYAQIVQALTDMYKGTYGQDIDVSTGTVDNIFISNLALIINNALRSFSMLYSNMNVNTATGEFLESLCDLANIKRKQATKSTAKIEITTGASSLTVDSNFSVVDSSGLAWNYEGPSLTIPANTNNFEIIVVCSVTGPIKCPADSLTAIENADYIVSQPNAGFEGSSTETDSELRARRAYSVGAAGTTVLEALRGALLSLAGVKDVYIYNNNSASAQSMADSVSVAAHNVYIAVRYAANANDTVLDAQIGKVIYEKLTPGVLSQVATSAAAGTGTAKNKSIDNYVGDEVVSTDTVYWKKVALIHPAIEVELTSKNHYSASTDDLIKQAIIDYANNLPINTDLDEDLLYAEIASADPLFQGRPTFKVYTMNITGSGDSSVTAFQYSASDITISDYQGV